MASRRSIAVVLRAEVAAYKRDMAAAAAATEQVAKEAETSGKRAESAFGRMEQTVSRNADSINRIAAGLAIAGGAMVGFAGLAVSRFADFDQAMSNVQAATGETAKNMEALRAAALAAGAETVYSATEAAAAIEELSKAGVATADILGGGLSGALNLAASDNIAVAEAAEIAASAMTQFKLSGQDVGHIADLLAAGAASAQGGVADLGQALNQSGLVASQFGLSVDETIGTLSAFASAGLLGSDAGTSFRTMLLRLANPAGEAATLMRDLGISAYDAQGNFVGMASLAGQLQESLGALPQAQRDAALATIFGSDAIRAANILYSQGVDGINEWIATVDQQGFAAEQAATRLDNLKGDLEGLSGAFETALIQMGEGANGPLRSAVQSVTEMINAWAELPPWVQQGTLALAGAGGFALLGTAAVLKVTTSIVELQAALRAVPALAGIAKASIAGLASAAFVVSIAALADGALQAGAAMNVARVDADDLAAALERAAGGADVAGTALSDIFRNKAALSFLPWVTEVESLDDALDKFGDSAREALSENFWERVDRFGAGGADMATFRKQVEQLDAAFASMVSSGAIDEAADLYDQFTEAAVEQGVQAERLAEFFPQYTSAVEGIIPAAEDAGEAVGILAAYQQEQATASEEAAKATEEWLKMVTDSDSAFIDLLGGYEQIIDKNREVAEETAAATESSKDSWEDYYDGFSVSLDEYLAGLEQMVAEQQAWETNMLILSGRVSEGVLDHLASLGPEGAPLVADLVNASDDELARLEDVFGQGASEATGEFASVLADAGPILAAIMASHGTEAAAAAAASLAAGESTLQGVIDQYDLDFVVDANTGQAQSTINAFVTSNNGRRLTVFVDAKTGAQTGFRTGPDAMPGLAVGGPVRGPGNGTSDSIPALLSNGEHVLTAAEVQAAGGHSAIFRMRAAMQAGLLKFASGGPVGATRLEILRAQQRIRDLERDLREMEKVKGGGKRYVLRGIDRAVATAELDEARSELRQLRNQGKQARNQLERERARERADLRGGLQTDLRRGNIAEAVRSGSGLSVVDDMLKWAENTALTKSVRSSLKTRALAAEKNLKKLYGRLQSAQETLTDIQQVYNSVRDGLGNEFNLAGSLTPTYSVQQNALGGYDVVSKKASGKSIAAGARAVADRIRTFAGKLTALRKAGASEALLQEVAALGSEQGIAAADALLADKGSIKSANQAFKDIAKYSQQAGLAVAQGMSGASGLNLKVAGGELGSGLVDSLNKQIGGVGTNLARGFASALGLKLNSAGTGLVRRAEGGFVSGPGTDTSDSIPALLSNGEFVMKAASVRKYGTAFMASVNAGRYAQGGLVGTSSTPQVVVRVDGAGGASRTYAPVIHTSQPVTPHTVMTAMRTAEFLDPGVDK